jgi:hypothetical protein
VTITTRERPTGTFSLKVDDKPGQTLEVQHGSVSFTVSAPGNTPLQKHGSVLAEMIGDPRIRTITLLQESWLVVNGIFVETANRTILIAIAFLLSAMLALGAVNVAEAQSDEGVPLRMPVADSSSAKEHVQPGALCPQSLPGCAEPGNSLPHGISCEKDHCRPIGLYWPHTPTRKYGYETTEPAEVTVIAVNARSRV